MDDFQVPLDARVDWGAINQAIGVATRMKEQEDQSRIAAIRYQGQREYEDLVKSGVESTEAIRRAAPKLYFQSPALAQVLRATAPQKPVPVMQPPQEATFGGRPGVINFGANGAQRFAPFSRPEAPPADPGVSALNSLNLSVARKPVVDAEAALAASPEVPGATKKEFAWSIPPWKNVPAPRPLTDAVTNARSNFVKVASSLYNPRMPVGDPNGPLPPSGLPVERKLTLDEAKVYLKAAGGDRGKARALARNDGYSF